MKRSRGFELTEARLHALLARLASDPGEAGEAYEALRSTLTRFFDWRGATFPDECADETLSRLARKIEEGEPVADVRRYALAVARFVWLEWARSPIGRTQPLEDDHLPAGLTTEAEPEPSVQAACLDRCLDALMPEGRKLILGYYGHERGAQIRERAKLADELRISANALRSRAQRLRDRLERCTRACVEGTDQPVRRGRHERRDRDHSE